MTTTTDLLDRNPASDHLNPAETSETPGGVTQHESSMLASYGVPPVSWTPADLEAAEVLSLGAVPVSAAATALVNELSALVEASEAETRRNRRQETGRAKQRRAVGAIVGGLLRAWSGRQPRAAFHELTSAAFNGGLVGHRQFTAAMSALIKLGMVSKAPGIRYGSGIDWGDGDTFSGKAARFRPTAALLQVAIDRGVRPGTLATDFAVEFATKPPAVPDVLRLTALKAPRRGSKARSADKQEIPIAAADRDAQSIADQVRAANARAAEHDVIGCLPPRWRRTFKLNWLLGGRWVAVGSDGNYQTLPKALRRGVRVDGEEIAEIDVRASWLTVMHGMLRLSLPDCDPYSVDGIPREIAKAWITRTLGKGSPVVSWPDGVDAEIATCPAAEAGSAIVQQYPFLREPWRVAEHLAPLGPPKRLLPHLLMAREAAGVTAALTTLWDQDILALPLHDALLVPRSAVEIGARALKEAFAAIVGVTPRLNV